MRFVMPVSAFRSRPSPPLPRVGLSRTLRKVEFALAGSDASPSRIKASMFVPFPSVGRFQIPLLAQRESLKTLDVDPAMFPPTMHDLQANEGIQQALGATDVSYLYVGESSKSRSFAWI